MEPSSDAASQAIADVKMKAAREAGVPEVYFNTFFGGVSVSDCFLILERNGLPAAVLNLSYTSAKSLSVALGSMIAHLEEKAGREMLTSRDVESILRAEAK